MDVLTVSTKNTVSKKKSTNNIKYPLRAYAQSGYFFVSLGLSGGSVVKIEVHVGKNRGDVGKNIGHVGKIAIDVGIPPYPLNKCVISLHRKG